MAKYRIETPNGNFEVESATELGDDEIQQLVASQGGPQVPTEAPNPEAGAGYFERVSRRVGEAGEAALGIPSSALDVVTGGDKGRLEAVLRLLRGVGSPVDILTSPVEAAVEYAATPYLSEEASRTAGSLSSLPLSLGVGLLAKAGKLGKYGTQFAKVLGVGATDAAMQFKHDPQLRYAAMQPGVAESEAALEQLARTAAPASEIAMAVKSPIMAEAILKKYKTQNDVWLENAKLNNIAGEIPASPILDHKQIMEFQVTKPYDLGLLGTLGTPTAQAAAIHPKGAQVAYDFAEAEMKLRRGIDARELRNQRALNPAGDKTISDAVKWQNIKDYDDIIANPKIPQDVKGVVTFLKDKFEVDRNIMIPRLRATEEERLRKALTAAEELKPVSARLPQGEFDKQIQMKVEKAIPSNATTEDLLMRVFPTYYRIMDKSGKFIESANNKSEAMIKIKDLADAGGLTAKDFKTSHRAVFDADTLRMFQGRVSRAMEQMAKNQGLTPAEVEAAIRGDFSLHAPSKFFNQLLGQSHRGYTRDALNALSFYDRTLEKWMQISEVEKSAKPVLKELHDRGYRRLTDMLYTSLQALQGRRSPIGEYIDNTLAATPVVNKLTSPYFMERWANSAKNGIVNSFIKYSPRFHVLNATQIAQTLGPIVDNTSEIVRAAKFRGTEAGTTLLTKHGIRGIGTRVEELRKSLGPVEGWNQEVAFLTMYDKARRLGLSDDQAAVYGRLRGNLHSQFLGLVTDVPHAFRKIDPTGLGMMFKRFPVKNVELVMDLVKSKQYPGVAKWLAVNLALGGMRAATFGNAGWLTLEAYDKIKKEFGEPAANVVHMGLPGLLGVDMSSSVLLFDPPFGDGWSEKVGNLLGGPVGSILGSVTAAAGASNAPEPEVGKRMYSALVNSLPVGRELQAIAQLLEGDYNLRDPLGRLRYKANMTDMFKKVLGFRTVEEANINTAVSAMMDMKQARDSVLNYAASRYGQAAVAGIPLGEEMEEIVKGEVDHWNAMWPEFPITGNAIFERTKARADAATQTLRERVLRSMPKVIRDAEQFRLPPGGG